MEDVSMPLPTELNTPPVTKMYLTISFPAMPTPFTKSAFNSFVWRPEKMSNTTQILLKECRIKGVALV
jgi:hypothetical protein